MEKTKKSGAAEGKTRKLDKKWIAVMAVVLVAVILLIIAVAGSGMDKLLSGAVRSDTLGVVVTFLVFVPILLCALLAVMLFGKDSVQTITVDASGIAPSSALEKAEVKSSEDEEENGERFCMLSDIDRRKESFSGVKYDKGITLNALCESFRSFSANSLHLYYDIDDIRRFIAGMAVSHILILQGMSGTGKTSLAYAFGAFVDNNSTIIPVQPMWKERTDLIGYYNEFTKKFNETLLLEKMYEANYSKDIYVTVLDEMNIARVEYYFAEFLSLLEYPKVDERYLEVVPDKWETDPEQLIDGRIKLPKNMWFIGTANNDDSTFAISDKVYDRAMIMNLDNKCESFAALPTPKMHISAAQFEKLVAEAMKEYELSHRNRKRLEELDKYLIEHFHITFGNRIMKQIRTYIPVFISCGGDELVALDDILAKKVMRKLETQNPIYLRNSAEGLLNYIDELFGQDKMPLCREFIRRLERNS